MGESMVDKTYLIEKFIGFGIILLIIGAMILPSTNGRSYDSTTNLHLNTQIRTDETISDWTNDVCSFHFYRNKWTIITNATDIDVDNLDLTQTTYTQQDIQATLSLQVAGRIENRGQYGNGTIDTIDLVEYVFRLTTSEQEYFISYMNQTGLLFYNDTILNLTSSDFTIMNNTLLITFPLMDLNETYENLTVIAYFIKADLSSQTTKIIYLSDTIPNLWTKVLLLGQFNSIDSRGAYMTLEAVHLWMIRFHPFQLIRYKPGEIIRISTPYKARLITDHFLIGMADVLEY
jgi:hypothetical protein